MSSLPRPRCAGGRRAVLRFRLFNLTCSAPLAGSCTVSLAHTLDSKSSFRGMDTAMATWHWGLGSPLDSQPWVRKVRSQSSSWGHTAPERVQARPLIAESVASSSHPFLLLLYSVWRVISLSQPRSVPLPVRRWEPIRVRWCVLDGT